MNNETKKAITLEELEAEYAKRMAKCETMRLQIEKKKREAEDRKRAQLALEKESREQLIEAKEQELMTLIKDYINDYGTYSKRITNRSDDDLFSYLYHLFF
jgi:hypothetical protein